MRFATQIWSDEFERNDAIDEYVTGAVDHAHSAFTDAGFKTVTTGNDFADHRVRGGGFGNCWSLERALIHVRSSSPRVQGWLSRLPACLPRHP
jgi:hypothetical protein